MRFNTKMLSDKFIIGVDMALPNSDKSVEIEEGWNHGELMFRAANGIILYMDPRFKELGEAIASSGSIDTKKIISKEEYKKVYGN